LGISNCTIAKSAGEQQEKSLMCDYSLEHVASRPAKIGDRLVTTSFAKSLTSGFCAVGEPNVAVCVMPGTEIAFDGEIEQPGILWKGRKLGSKVARFRRVNEGCRSMHHDALELPEGRVVLLASLREGQLATVIQLPATDRRHMPQADDAMPNWLAVSPVVD
jgi:hypothetical protein